MNNRDVAKVVSELRDTLSGFREDLAKVRIEFVGVAEYCNSNFTDQLAALRALLGSERYPNDRIDVLAHRLACERSEAAANAAKASAILADVLAKNEQLRARLARKRKNARRG